MAYDEGLAQRIQEILEETKGLKSGVAEKKMFGGICYLTDGNMAFGIIKEYLIVRVGPDEYTKALEQPHTKVFDITGRVMKGWVMVSPEGYDADDDLGRWIARGIRYAASLPPK